MVVYKHFYSPFLLQLLVILVLFIALDFRLQFQNQHIFSIQMVYNMYKCNNNQGSKMDKKNQVCLTEDRRGAGGQRGT